MSVHYLIVDYSDNRRDEESKPTFRRDDLEDLWDEINEAREDTSIKIAIYEIGKIVLDWS